MEPLVTAALQELTLQTIEHAAGERLPHFYERPHQTRIEKQGEYVGGVEPDAALAVWVREVGALILASSVTTLLARKAEDSLALRTASGGVGRGD